MSGASNDANPFDDAARHYDAWFDTVRGRAIFESEVACLRPFVTASFRPWLEIGVGTGRFAQELGVKAGVDPSSPMLALTANRGIDVRQGTGEALPYGEGAFGGILIVVALCFLADPARALREAARVLRPNGRLVIGFIPAESQWAVKYADLGRQGHPIYRKARFYGLAEAVDLTESAGFGFQEGRSTLFDGPEAEIVEVQPVRSEISPLAGFVAMCFGSSSRL